MNTCPLMSSRLLRCHSEQLTSHAPRHLFLVWSIAMILRTLPPLLKPPTPSTPSSLSPPSRAFLRTLLATPPITIPLLRSLLHHPRYASHARTALRAHDLPAILCLVAILPPPAHPPPSLPQALQLLSSQAAASLSLLHSTTPSLEHHLSQLTLTHKEEQLRTLRSSHRLTPLLHEEQRLRLQLNEAEAAMRARMERRVALLETAREERRKEFEERVKKVEWEDSQASQRLVTAQSTLADGRSGLRAHRESLEKSLRGVMRAYNAGVGGFDGEFEELEKRRRELAKERSALEELGREVDERFDEMVRLRRLKELLRNLERADGVKKNWAARRIQEAWRRYKIMKLRRRKLRGKKKKKK